MSSSHISVTRDRQGRYLDQMSWTYSHGAGYAPRIDGASPREHFDAPACECGVHAVQPLRYKVSDSEK